MFSPNPPGILDENGNLADFGLQIVPCKPLSNAKTGPDFTKLAVRGYGLSLKYQSSGRTLQVLNRLTFNIPCSSIYGLLGPSGCGKTTLLRIITGFIRPDSGSISVFGFRPRQYGSAIPGEGIGYMPQEVSLIPDLTVNEILSYFGRLYFMDSIELKHRINELIEFLEIPDRSRLIGTLSGGQQRRLSLACAIIHRPRLAILDEPTVGVDPLLCTKIWQLLHKLCFQHSITVLMTTHYIEECRKASVVGFMRSGEILEEDRPEAVLARHQCPTLEQTFLKICLSHKTKRRATRDAIATYFTTYHKNDDPQSGRVIRSPLKTHRDSFKIYSLYYTVSTLVWRYLIQSFRNPVFLLLFILFPTGALTTMYLCLGQPPKNIPVAWIVDDVAEYNSVHSEQGNFASAYEKYQIPFYPDVIKSQINKDIINLIPYENLDDAIEDIRSLKIKGALVMHSGFSESLHARINIFSGLDVDDYTIKKGIVEVYGDMTNKFIMITLELCLQLTMAKVMNLVAPVLNRSEHQQSMPILLGEVVEGTMVDFEGLEMVQYATPGFILATLYSCGFALSCLAFLAEVNSKMIDRNLSTGISTFQLIMAQSLTRFLLFIPNILILLFMSIYVFGVKFHNSIPLALALISLQTFSGIAFGILFSALFPRLEHTLITSISVYFFIMSISGLFWPLKALPYFMVDMSTVSPFTLPSITLQALFSRRHPSFSNLIWPGFYVSIAWAIAPIIMVVIVLKYKSYN